jgi:GAF domain-containing protein
MTNVGDEFSARGEPARGPDYVESLRRIATSLASGNSLRDVLQQIVEAVCDHTQWRLSWIYAMDTHGGFGEIIARRDRMEYTLEPPQRRWPFDGIPSFDALQRNEIIAIPDARTATEYAAMQESARARGVIACAYVPLSSSDPQGRPMVLCVQSGRSLLSDPTQLPFLKAVASLASLAASNAALLADARSATMSAIESAELLTSTMDAVSAGSSKPAIIERIEATTHRSIIAFHGSGHLLAVGAPPEGCGLSQDEWGTFLEIERRRIFADATAATSPGQDAGHFIIQTDAGAMPAMASRFGAQERWPSVIVTIGERDARHRSASTASAMVLLREQIALEAEASLQQEVVAQILDGDVDDRFALRSRAAFAGIDIDAAYFLVVQEQKGGLTTPALNWPGAIVQPVRGCLVMLLPGSDAASAEARLLVERLSAKSAAIITMAPSALTIAEVPEAWRRCLQTVQLAQKVGRSGCVRLDDFGAYRVLLPALEREDIVEFIEATIGPLLRDEALGAELFATAEAFAAAGGRFQETARRLFIHVSTLRYRLGRISTLLGKDLNDEETRFEVSLAIRMQRLRAAQQSGSPHRRTTLPQIPSVPAMM